MGRGLPKKGGGGMENGVRGDMEKTRENSKKDIVRPSLLREREFRTRNTKDGKKRLKGRKKLRGVLSVSIARVKKKHRVNQEMEGGGSKGKQHRN